MAGKFRVINGVRHQWHQRKGQWVLPGTGGGAPTGEWRKYGATQKEGAAVMKKIDATSKPKVITTRMKVATPIPGVSALRSKVAARKAELTRAIKSKATAIKPQRPALISEQVNKAKRIPYIIGGVLIAVYVLFKKGRKGGKK